MARAFFRIVQGKTASLEDFKSHQALGRRLTNPDLEREWSEGVSVYDDFDRACEISRKFNFRLGSYVVRLVIPEGRIVEYRQTTRDKQHYTIYAQADEILALVKESSIHIPGAPGDDTK